MIGNLKKKNEEHLGMIFIPDISGFTKFVHDFDIKQGKTTKKAQYGKLPLVERSNLFDYQFNGSLRSALDQHDFKNLFVDAIKTGLALNQEYDNQRQFTLYQQYAWC